MTLSWKGLAGLFVLGAVIGPIGDHIHVVTGTTRYYDSWVPVIGDSPLWFPLVVGLATAALGAIRVRLAPVRPGLDVRHGIGVVAAVLVTYAFTGILNGTSIFALTVLIVGMAALTWAAFGDDPAIVCGVMAAVGGPAAEIIGTWTNLFDYADSSDGLLGVAPWLPALYFAFGVAAALLGELVAGRSAVSE